MKTEEKENVIYYSSRIFYLVVLILVMIYVGAHYYEIYDFACGTELYNENPSCLFVGIFLILLTFFFSIIAFMSHRKDDDELNAPRDFSAMAGIICGILALFFLIGFQLFKF